MPLNGLLEIPSISNERAVTSPRARILLQPPPAGMFDLLPSCNFPLFPLHLPNESATLEQNLLPQLGSIQPVFSVPSLPRAWCQPREDVPDSFFEGKQQGGDSSVSVGELRQP